jgi:hypothetical protein
MKEKPRTLWRKRVCTDPLTRPAPAEKTPVRSTLSPKGERAKVRTRPQPRD